MSRVVLISSDCHAGIPTAEYRPYLEQRYHADLDDYESSLEAFLEKVQPFPDEVMAERTEVSGRSNFADPQERLVDLEHNGVVSEVLFPGATPDTGPPWTDFLSAGVFRARTPRARELQSAGERAYNRWLAEFCAAVPTHRRLGLAFLPLHDVEAAVAEVRWAVEAGLRGVVLPFFNYDVPEYCHGWYWDPIWRACEETGLSLNFHGGYGLPEFGAFQQFMSLEHMFFARRPITHLILTGVFDRFPNLRFAVTESFAGWVPQTMGELDRVYAASVAANQGKKVLFDTSQLPERKPSEYWLTNGFVGVSIVNLTEMNARHEIGVETMMFGIDYPHPEGSWGQATTWLQASLGRAGATEEEARQILGLNAARLYDVDVDALSSVVERVGPTIGEVLSDASDEAIEALLEDANNSGRALASIQYGRTTSAANTGL